MRRVRQLPFPARHVRRHARRSKISLLRLSHPREERFWCRIESRRGSPTGADTEKIRKWDHAQLSTYGIGKEHNRPEWAAIGRELIRLGFLR